MQNAAFSNRHLSLMADMANANAEKILKAEADKYTRLKAEADKYTRLEF
jgi:hypothetical protein